MNLANLLSTTDKVEGKLSDPEPLESKRTKQTPSSSAKAFNLDFILTSAEVQNQSHEEKKIETDSTNVLEEKPSASKKAKFPFNRRGDPCSVDNCVNLAVSKGKCIKHGGGNRCRIVNCTRGAKLNKLCHAHGGTRICKAEGCKTSPKRRGFCWVHGGGGKLCSRENCEKGALFGGFCWSHGGGKRCQIKECNKPPVGGVYCKHHKALVNDKTIKFSKIHT